MKLSSALKYLVPILVMASSLTMHGATNAQDAPDLSVRAFDIPTQPLSDALAAYQDQAGIDVTFEKAIALGKTNQAIHGGYRPDAALQSMLRGTGLTFSWHGKDGIEIAPAPPSSSTDQTHPADSAQAHVDQKP